MVRFGMIEKIRKITDPWTTRGQPVERIYGHVERLYQHVERPYWHVDSALQNFVQILSYWLKGDICSLTVGFMYENVRIDIRPNKSLAIVPNGKVKYTSTTFANLQVVPRESQV